MTTWANPSELWWPSVLQTCYKTCLWHLRQGEAIARSCDGLLCRHKSLKTVSCSGQSWPVQRGRGQRGRGYRRHFRAGEDAWSGSWEQAGGEQRYCWDLCQVQSPFTEQLRAAWGCCGLLGSVSQLEVAQIWIDPLKLPCERGKLPPCFVIAQQQLQTCPGYSTGRLACLFQHKIGLHCKGTVLPFVY